jgi:thaumarchaeosortase
LSKANIDIKAYANKLSLPLSFVLPILVLYLLDPNSFQWAWKGRAPYIFFLWFLCLELILVWKNFPRSTFEMSKWGRTLATLILMITPTIYVLALFLAGLNNTIIEFGKLVVPKPYQEYYPWFLYYSWPLSVEILTLAILFIASTLLAYGVEGVKRFSVSLFFLGATGSFYMIDNIYPFGTLIALQSLVPVTATLATTSLNFIGYPTQLRHYFYTKIIDGVKIGELVSLMEIKSTSPTLRFAINWPCAGVHSLFIYSFASFLFIKNLSVPIKWKVIYFITGAIGTFLINVLRIITIVIIGINAGIEAAMVFHSYYGELFFIFWILTYFSIITYGHRITATISYIAIKLKRHCGKFFPSQLS